MVKKALAGVAGVVVLGVLLYGTSFFGLAKTGLREIQKSAKDAIPLSAQIANAERMVEELDAEILRYTRAVTDQQVDLKNADERFAGLKKQRDAQKEQILALNKELQRGEKEYVFAGKTLSAEKVKEDLALKMNNIQKLDATLKRDEELLAKRRKVLSVTEANFEKVVAQKKSFKQDIEFLKVQMEQLKAEEAVGALNIDESKMAEARKTIDELRSKLDKEARFRDAVSQQQTEIEVPIQQDHGDISKRVEDYFGDEAKAKTDL